MPPRADLFRRRFAALEAESARVIVGQRETARGALTALFVGGHVLLEGVPGIAKGLSAGTIAHALILTHLRMTRPDPDSGGLARRATSNS